MKTELVTTLKRQATRILADLRESKEPILITEHGLPSAYLLDVEDYEHLMTRMNILEGIARASRVTVPLHHCHYITAITSLPLHRHYIDCPITSVTTAALAFNWQCATTVIL